MKSLFDKFKKVSLTAQPVINVLDDLIAIQYGISRQSFSRWTSTPAKVHTPIKLSSGCTRWKLADIEEWEISK